ncbi:hypothetical protein GCM10018963_57730 [Saccharothrix longispora]
MTGVTARTPGIAATRSGRSGARAANSMASIRTSARAPVSASRTASASADTMGTVTAVQTARHTISALDVEAVRRGLRRAFSTASLPRMPVSATSGRRSTAVRPVAASGVSTTRPITSSGAPR